MALTIEERLTQIREKVRQIEKQSDRPEGSVRLIAVSKTKPLEMIREAMSGGQKDFGENKVQDLAEKAEAIPEARWHMIGSLQRNKVKYLAPFIHLIHSVDSEKLLREINKQGEKNNRKISCLLQLNISDEEQKSGMSESEAEAILKTISQYPFTEIRGLMGMAALTENESVIKSQFNRLTNARESFRQYEGPQIRMEELSMGMSGDYPMAIQEGSTMIRIGSAIFGPRNYG